MDTAGAVTGIMTDRTTTIAMAGAAGSGTVTADFMAATTDTATEPDSKLKIGNGWQITPPVVFLFWRCAFEMRAPA